MKARPFSIHALAATLMLAIAVLAVESVHSTPKPKTGARVKTTQKGDTGSTPIEHAEALDAFFQALDALKAGETIASKRIVRILHFGDSHTASDFLTGHLRQLLQASYGDAGPGLLLPARPWRGYRHEGVEQEFGKRWPSVSLRSGEPDAKVGLAGAALSIPKGQRFVIRGALADFRLHVLGPEDEAPMVEISGGVVDNEMPVAVALQEADRLTLEDGRALRILAPVSPGRTDELSIGLPQKSRLLGVDLLSGRPGVLYDELGLNGAELLDLERWDPAVRQFLLWAVKPGLLVLAYGTNDMGRTDFDPVDYRARTARLLTTLKVESGAPILVMGPPDRAGWRRRMNPKAGARAVTQALRAASAEAGCAFWDARKAMGGEGAIQRWRAQGLTQRDLVHFTAPGYQRLGELIYRALLEAKKQREGRARP